MSKPQKYRSYSVKGMSKRRPPGQRPPPHAPTPPPVEEPNESRQRTIYRQIGAHPGDEAVAKRLETLERRMPQSTIPELLAYDWLKQHNYAFESQAEVSGGRRVRGGKVPDFVIQDHGIGLAWLVQGGYFHSEAFQRRFGQQDRDIIAELELKGKFVSGVRIDTVVQLWENEIYHARPNIFWRAIQGGA